MISKYLTGPVPGDEATLLATNIAAGDYVDVTLSTDYSRFALVFTPVSAEPIIVYSYPASAPTYEEAIQTFGIATGTMIAPFCSNVVDAGAVHRFTFSTAVEDVYLYEDIAADMLYLSRSVGPVSISTYGPGSVVPFTVAITCKPLFLEPFPALRYFTRGAANATGLIAFAASLVDLYEWEATALILNKEVQCNVAYAYTAGDEGKVVSAVLRPNVTDSAPKYSLVADLIVGIPQNGSQSSVVIGLENPANYVKRAYVPRRGSNDEFAYEPMPPIILQCTALDEIQASGRLRYEHSILLLGEPAVHKYIVTANVLEGAGNVSIYDNEQEHAELAEYEY